MFKVQCNSLIWFKNLKHQRNRLIKPYNYNTWYWKWNGAVYNTHGDHTHARDPIRLTSHITLPCTWSNQSYFSRSITLLSGDKVTSPDLIGISINALTCSRWYHNLSALLQHRPLYDTANVELLRRYYDGLCPLYDRPSTPGYYERLSYVTVQLMVLQLIWDARFRHEPLYDSLSTLDYGDNNTNCTT